MWEDLHRFWDEDLNVLWSFQSRIHVQFLLQDLHLGAYFVHPKAHQLNPMKQLGQWWNHKGKLIIAAWSHLHRHHPTFAESLGHDFRHRCNIGLQQNFSTNNGWRTCCNPLDPLLRFGRSLLLQCGNTTFESHWPFNITWMNHLGITWHEMSLQHLVEILSLAKDAAKHDVKAVRLQPMHILRGLRWLVKTALMDDVATLLNNALIARGSTQPRDRKEAVPVPLWVLINWELHVIHPDTPDWTRLLLGGFLLACWGSLRYADLQRIQVTSLNLAIGALRGTCRMTKTTRSGQPFAVVTSGFVGDSPQSSWIYVWLKALQAAVYRSYPFCPDFIIPVLDHYHSPTGNAPLPYAAALKALRWAAQTPWGKPTLSAEQAHQLTLHSLKVTFLSAAAQLRLPESSRKLQGNHTGGSVQLYSRDDTIEALWVQSQVASAVRNGWRAVRPLQRGGQTPIPEPPILMELSPLSKPFDMPMEDELEMFLEGSNAIDTTSLCDSSSSSTSSSSTDTSDSETLEDSPQQTSTNEFLFVQNGPAGCCHAMIQAPANTAGSKIFTFHERGWTTRCGASLRSSAIQIETSMIQWPCRRAACRAIFDRCVR